MAKPVHNAQAQWKGKITNNIRCRIFQNPIRCNAERTWAFVKETKVPNLGQNVQIRNKNLFYTLLVNLYKTYRLNCIVSQLF